MATQGIVSVREDGEVVMKIVTGADGYNADKVAAVLKESWPVNSDKAYDIATENFPGSVESLVVLTRGKTLFKGDGELDPRYEETFSDPEFNPRWKHGTADHVEIVDVESE